MIGEPRADYAINVFFESQKKSYWFDSQLLELVDHAPGTEITVDGVPKKRVRVKSGEWIENAKKPWWKFW